MELPIKIEVAETKERGAALRARTDIARGEAIFKFEGTVRPEREATPFALQIGADEYLESSEGFDNYLNHSCDPNCIIDFDRMMLVAKRDIATGEELSYDYHTTEYDLTAHGRDLSFSCACGSPECVRQVRGFRHLSAEKKEKIKDLLFPYLKTCPPSTTQK